MKRTLNVGNSAIGKQGVVVDTMSYIDLGDKQVNEKIGVCTVDDDGIGTYFTDRESRYCIVFRGLSRPIYDDVGNPDNWVDRIRHAIPEKPILHPIPSNYDVRSTVGAIMVRLYWHLEENRVKSDWNVEVSIDGGNTWALEAENLSNLTVELPLVESNTTYKFRVCGVNKVGQKGEYSNIVSYTTQEIDRGEDLVPPQNTQKIDWTLE